MSHQRLRRCLPAASLVVLLAANVFGQQFQLPSTDQLRGLQSAAAAPAEGPTVTVKSVFTAAAKGEPGQLYITAEIKPGWHIYSITQPKGGPVASKIKLTPAPGYKITGDFKAVPPAEVRFYPDAYKDLPIEEHEGRVIWHAPLELSAGVNAATLKIEGKLNVQACDEGNCLPPHDYPFTAALGQAPPLPAEPKAPAKTQTSDPPKSASYKNSGSHTEIRGEVNVNTTTPGQTVALSFTATPAEAWHVYALADKVGAVGSKPTLIVFTDLPPGWSVSAPRASTSPVVKQDGPANFQQPYHEGPVTWTVDISVPPDAAPGEHRLSGLFGFQTCNSDVGCDRPLATRFEANIKVGPTSVPGGSLVTFADGSYAETAKLAAQQGSSDNKGASPPLTGAFDPAQLKTNASGGSSNTSTPLMLLFGFLGGLILNLMPCVLPVIGLKILSFVEQGGQERGRVLWLNIWYSLGLMSVFMVLACLAAFLGYGWGQQFASSTFNVVLTSIVFAMALSFLGVWEIPIPGFVGTGKANDLAAREGVPGAFAKGMITTVLATPCTGPFLGTALAWAVRQPPYLTFMLFGCVGLGMASPYLVLGAFPSLVRFLPRPGAWMETFKQLMGFVLLGTVVFLLTFIEWYLVVPTIALLFGIWLACWWIGRTPFTADFGVKARAWMTSAIMVGLAGLVSFNWLSSVMDERFVARMDKEISGRLASQGGMMASTSENEGHRLPWQPFSKQTLTELTGQQKTVMVDFTADWCLICKSLEKLVLNTEEVKGVIDANQVVPLLADWTHLDGEVTAMLELLGSKQVPVLAIFPAGRPNEPIVFVDPYTPQQLIDALKKAGPSQVANNATSKGAHHLAWRDFTPTMLRERQAAGDTVLLHVTADWDLISKAIEERVLNTKPVANAVSSNGVVTFRADWTTADPVLTAYLGAIGIQQQQTPATVIFPAGRPNEPIIFRDPFTQQQLIDALKKAGPSQRAAVGNATAMRD